MVRLLIWGVLTACYTPRVVSGSPCDPGPCPPGLVCSPATHTCEATASDASVVDRDDAPLEVWLAGYTHRKRVTLSPTTTVITLVDYPVSILEPSDADLASGARSDGSDIAFTASDGTTLLSSELVSFSSTTGALDAWARITLPAAGAVLYMYYGGPPTTPSISTWSQFAGVWHMGGTVSVAPDSTSHQHDASAAIAGNQTPTVNGLVGIARDYDGVDDSLSIPDPSDGSLDFDTGSFSYSVWVNVTSSVGPYDLPFFKGGSSLTFPGYDMELGTGGWAANLSDGVRTIYGQLGQEANLLGQWRQLVAVIDRATSKLRLYVNGVSVNVVDITGVGSLNSARELSFGLTNDQFHGQLDEVRVYAGALSPSWIAVEYENFTARAQLVTIGPAENQ